MARWIELYKPAASRRTHLLAASSLWSLVGTLLLFFGVRWVIQAHIRYPVLPIAVAIVLGAIKARFVLARAADRIAERIRSRGDRRCIGGFLSWRTWGLVAVMAGAGRLIRSGVIPQIIVGFVYTAVGAALLLASLRLWSAWRRHARGTAPSG